MIHRRFAVLGQRLCLIAAAIGAFGLFAWVVGPRELTRIVPGQPPMMPNTALCLTLLGAAGALSRPHGGGVKRTLAVLASSVTLAISVLTLAAYVSGSASNIDVLLVESGVGPHPGRMSPPTALALGFLAMAVLLVDARPTSRVRPSESLALSSGLIGLTALTGQLLGAGQLYRFAGGSVAAVAVHTAFALMLVSVGILCERSNAGLMRVVASPGPGGVMMRRLAVAAVLAPLALGLALTHVLGVLGVEQLPLVYGTLSVAATVVGLSLLTATALPLDRMNADLEVSRATGQALFEQASEGIFVADIDGRYTDVNSAGCRMVGYSRDELIGRFVTDLIPPDQHERLAHHKEALLRGESRLGEWTLRCKDGSLVAVEVNARIDRNGRWEAFVRDVTERKRVESEKELLAEVGLLFGATLEADCTLVSIAELLVRRLADACIIDVRDDGGEARRVVALHGDGAPTCAGPNPGPAGGPLGMLSSSGERHPLLFEHASSETLSLLALDGADGPDASLRSVLVAPLVVRDELIGAITLTSWSSSRVYAERDVRLLEEVAQRTALWLENVRLYRRAQCAIRARDDVLGVVAHDLRNPLGAIVLQASLLRRQLEASGQARKPAELIERAARRMDRLIHDLVDVTRIEAGRLSIELARRSPGAIVSDAFEAQRPLADAASLELRLDVADELPDIWVDRDRLLQVFENLVGNAMKFVRPGGRITVGAVPRDRDVLFWVADTGRGIRAEDLPHLFDRFWQARRGEGGGTGMGLPIVKGIVEAHGGRVWVESEPDRGSTFFFTIPAVVTVAPSQTMALATG